VIIQPVFAYTQCEGLVDCRRFFLRIGALHLFAATCIQWIVNKSIRASVWLFFVQRAGAEDTVCVAVLRIEVKRFGIPSQRLKTIGVFPFAIRAGIARGRANNTRPDF